MIIFKENAKRKATIGTLKNLKHNFGKLPRNSGRVSTIIK